MPPEIKRMLEKWIESLYLLKQILSTDKYRNA